MTILSSMRAKGVWLAVGGVLSAFVLAGCETPQTRIEKNPAVFARLTPQQQEMIKKGQVAVGFDQEMVQLALGEPDHIITRTDASGVSEIWSYTTYDLPDGMPLYRGWYHRYWGDPFYPYYLNYPYRREYEHLRVVFKGGKVVSIEQRKQ